MLIVIISFTNDIMYNQCRSGITCTLNTHILTFLHDIRSLCNFLFLSFASRIFGLHYARKAALTVSLLAAFLCCCRFLLSACQFTRYVFCIFFLLLFFVHFFSRAKRYRNAFELHAMCAVVMVEVVCVEHCLGFKITIRLRKAHVVTVL